MHRHHAIWILAAVLAACGCSSSEPDVPQSHTAGAAGESSGGAAGAVGGTSGGGAGGESGALWPELPEGCRPAFDDVACLPAACREHRCGESTSVFDGFGCFRPTCQEDEECGAGARCREVDYAPVSCGYSGDGSACRCGSLTSIETASFCFPR